MRKVTTTYKPDFVDATNGLPPPVYFVMQDTKVGFGGPTRSWDAPWVEFISDIVKII